MKQLTIIMMFMLITLSVFAERTETEQYNFKDKVIIAGTNLFINGTNIENVINALSNNFANISTTGTYVKADGTIPFTANANFGGHNLTNIGPANLKISGVSDGHLMIWHGQNYYYIVDASNFPSYLSLFGNSNYPNISVTNNIANMENQTNTWNDVTNKITANQSTNIAYSIHTFDKTNLITVMGVNVGNVKTYTIDPTIADKFYINLPTNLTNNISFPSTGYDMQSITVVLPSYGFLNQLTDYVDFGGITGIDLKGVSGEVIYIGLRKRPFSNLWDVIGVSKGYGL